MKLLSVGDNIPVGSYEVHSRFGRVVNFTNGKNLVSLVDLDIGAGPLNIVVQGLNSEKVSYLEIEKQSVLIDDLRFPLESRIIYDSRIEPKNASTETLFENLGVLENLLLELSDPKGLAFLLDEKRRKNFRPGFETTFVKQITDGVEMIFNGDIVQGVHLLKGCGFGLTPSGDDFLSGLLFGLQFMQKVIGKNLSGVIEKIYLNSTGDNFFSNTFLLLAKEGLLFERFKDMIQSLLSGMEESIRKSVRKLLSVGESSGADMCTGFLLALKNGDMLWSSEGE